MRVSIEHAYHYVQFYIGCMRQSKEMTQARHEPSLLNRLGVGQTEKGLAARMNGLRRG